MTSLPSAPGAHAVILEWDHRQDDTDAWESEYIRIKIFDREAAKYADIELPYVGGFSWIRKVEARTIHPDGTIIPFDGKTYDKVIAKNSRLAFMARTFTLPDVQPGSILEYSYVRAASSTYLRPTHWVLQHELPVLKETIWFSPSRYLRSYFTYQGLPEGKAPRRERTHFELTLENMPAVETEPFSPPDRHTMARVDFYYTEHDTDESLFWQRNAGSHADWVARHLSDSRLIRRTAEELTAEVTTPEEKLRRIYSRVQQIRNISYEQPNTAGDRGCESHRNVDGALKKGCGNRILLNRLFVSLARVAGFDAFVVESSSRDDAFFSETVPDYSQLDHEIALVVIDGKDRFFDPATPMAPFGLLPWEVTAVKGMKLVKGGGVFIGTPHLAPTEAVIRRKADLHIDGGVVKGAVTIAFIGQEALQQRLERRNDDEPTNRKAIEELVKTWLPEGSSVKLETLGSMKSSEEPLTATFEVELTNIGSITGSRSLLPLSIFTLVSRNPFSASKRKHDIYFHHERQTEDEVVLAIPDGYAIESLPAVRELNLGGLAFRNSWSHDEHAVTFKRTFTVNTLLIPKTSYELVRQLYDSSLAADQESIILKH